MSTQGTSRPLTEADLPPSPPPRRRGMGTIRSMLLSMGVLTVILLAFYAVVVRPERVDRLPVDAVAAARNARQVGKAPFSVLEPPPPGWRANNATFASSTSGTPTWSVGYVGDGRYFGLRQAAKAPEGWFTEQLGECRRDGSRRVDGATWEQWVNPSSHEYRLVRRADAGLSTIAVSSSSYDEAAATLAEVRPRP